jgi:HK97 family phage prohead protease
MADLEYRAKKNLSLRCQSGEPVSLVGYASTFDSPYEVEGMIETVHRSAFDRTLREMPDVFALVSHDPGRVVGRTTNGSLALRSDDNGLHVTLTPIDTQEGRDLATLVRTGTIDSMSFGFIVKDDKIEMRDGRMHRQIRDLELHEVSCVAFPANSQARISARSKQRADEIARSAVSQIRLERMRRLLILPIHNIGGSTNGTV